MRRVALAPYMFLFAALSAAAHGQIVPPGNGRPAAASAKVDRIPSPRDVPYPGTIQLTVDATDVTRGIFRVHERVPVPGPGDFVMLYPKWIQGAHSPRGDIRKVAGLRVSANKRPLEWVRDDIDVT